MKGSWCSYCGKASESRDHILPRAWGRRDDAHMKVARPCCTRCNEFRSVCGHCPGAMAALRAVAGDPAIRDKRHELDLAALWGWRGARAQIRAAAVIHPDAIPAARQAWPPMYPIASEIRPEQTDKGR